MAATTRAGKAVWSSAMDTPVGAFLGPNWVTETTTIKMHAAPRPARPVIGPRSVKDGLVNLSGNVRDQLDEPAVVAIGQSIPSVREGVSHPHHRERNPRSSPSPWEPNILSTSARRGWSWPTALSSFWGASAAVHASTSIIDGTRPTAGHRVARENELRWTKSSTSRRTRSVEEAEPGG